MALFTKKGNPTTATNCILVVLSSLYSLPVQPTSTAYHMCTVPAPRLASPTLFGGSGSGDSGGGSSDGGARGLRPTRPAAARPAATWAVATREAADSAGSGSGSGGSGSSVAASVSRRQHRLEGGGGSGVGDAAGGNLGSSIAQRDGHLAKASAGRGRGGRPWAATELSSTKRPRRSPAKSCHAARILSRAAPGAAGLSHVPVRGEVERVVCEVSGRTQVWCCAPPSIVSLWVPFTSVCSASSHHLPRIAPKTR